NPSATAPATLTARSARATDAAGDDGSSSRADHDAAARLWNERHGSPPGTRGLLARGTKAKFAEGRPQNDPHFHGGERSTEAVAVSASEGMPFLPIGASFEESLGPERQRIGIQIGSTVDQDQARRDRGACGKLVTADRRGLRQR